MAKRKADDRESREVSADAIAERAYEISQSEHAGTDEANWFRAEQELRGAGSDLAGLEIGPETST